MVLTKYIIGMVNVLRVFLTTFALLDRITVELDKLFDICLDYDQTVFSSLTAKLYTSSSCLSTD